MSIEAMKMALHALNIQTPLVQREFELRNSAIEALRQAIEQAEKQEPVAWFVQYEYRHEFLWRKPNELEQKTALEIRPLYTAPVDAVNISQERVDETAKGEHEPVEMFKHWSLNWLVGKYYGTYISNGILRIHIWNEPTGKVSPREIDAGWKDGDDFDHTESLEDYELAVRICEALNAPPKREWVGLTEDEVLECFDSVALGAVEKENVIDKRVNIFNAIKAIEAKLKEKNT
jgi:hypothetical protein